MHNSCEANVKMGFCCYDIDIFDEAVDTILHAWWWQTVLEPHPLMKPPQFFQLGIQLPVAHSPLSQLYAGHAPDHQATYCQVSSQN